MAHHCYTRCELERKRRCCAAAGPLNLCDDAENLCGSCRLWRGSAGAPLQTVLPSQRFPALPAHETRTLVLPGASQAAWAAA